MFLDKPSKRLAGFPEISGVERALSELITRHVPRVSVTQRLSRKKKQLALHSNRNLRTLRRKRNPDWLPMGTS